MYPFRGSPSLDLEFDREGLVICQNGYHIRDPGGAFYQMCTFWRAELKVAKVVAEVVANSTRTPFFNHNFTHKGSDLGRKQCYMLVSRGLFDHI